MHSAMEFEPKYKALTFYSIASTQGLLPLHICAAAEIGGASAHGARKSRQQGATERVM
jgi:hypothetical protein